MLSAHELSDAEVMKLMITKKKKKMGCSVVTCPKQILLQACLRALGDVAEGGSGHQPPQLAQLWPKAGWQHSTRALG